jgi:ribosomal protein S15P/S13E
MNLDDSWIEISVSYMRKCSKCNQTITLIQTGDTIPENILDEIVNIVHVQNHFDAYTKDFQVEEKLIKIDLQINHIPCEKYCPFSPRKWDSRVWTTIHDTEKWPINTDDYC